MTTPASTAHPRPLSLTITPTTSTSLLPSLAHLHRLAFASTALAQALNARVAPSALEAWRAADMATYMHPYHVARGKTVVVATFGELGGLGEAGGLGELGGTGVGELVGYAVWDEVRPERVLSREEAKLERPEGPGLPEGMERELAGDYFGRMAERRKAFSGDRFRLTTDLNATPEGKPTYLKLGFVQTAEPVYAKDRSFHSTAMIRQPRTP